MPWISFTDRRLVGPWPCTLHSYSVSSCAFPLRHSLDKLCLCQSRWLFDCPEHLSGMCCLIISILRSRCTRDFINLLANAFIHHLGIILSIFHNACVGGWQARHRRRSRGRKKEEGKKKGKRREWTNNTPAAVSQRCSLLSHLAQSHMHLKSLCGEGIQRRWANYWLSTAGEGSSIAICSRSVRGPENKPARLGRCPWCWKGLFLFISDFHTAVHTLFAQNFTRDTGSHVNLTSKVNILSLRFPPTPLWC